MTKIKPDEMETTHQEKNCRLAEGLCGSGPPVPVNKVRLNKCPKFFRGVIRGSQLHMLVRVLQPIRLGSNCMQTSISSSN